MEFGVVKNLIVANELPGSRCPRSELERMLRAQIENSLELGWKPDDLWIVANFEFEWCGVQAFTTTLNAHCLTGSKMFALEWLFQAGMVRDVVWSHDLDCWQNEWFAVPVFMDVGACHYSRPKFNGGSVFWKPAARDLVATITIQLQAPGVEKEEPILQKVFTERPYRSRITVLNSTFNVGCSGFVERLLRAEQPIRVCHLHPNNRVAWETHVLDRNGLGQSSMGLRLESLLRRHYPGLATALSVSGEEKARQARQARRIRPPETTRELPLYQFPSHAGQPALPYEVSPQ